MQLLCAACLLRACCRSATGQLQEAADARSAAEAERDQLSAEKEQLLPQLEQARWQNRQLEKKLEEAVAGRSKAEEVGHLLGAHLLLLALAQTCPKQEQMGLSF
jgi:chromosome segregation ATPase